MKYEYVTSDKLKKSLKKKDISEFENQIRIIASGIYYGFEFHRNDDKHSILETATQKALNESKNYKDDGNSTFIHFSNIIKESIISQSK